MNEHELKIMTTAIANQVKETVNGKIDKIAVSLRELDDKVCNLQKDFKTHSGVVQPIIEQFQNKQGFWVTMEASGKNFAIASGLVVSLGIIVGFILKIYQ